MTSHRRVRPSTGGAPGGRQGRRDSEKPSGSAPILNRVADPRHPPGRFDEEELTAAVKTGTERWLTELRLAIFGIVISVGIGAADIGLQAGGWVGGLVAGVGSVAILLAILWATRPTPHNSPSRLSSTT
jgi:hypothetical protein